MSSVQRTIPPIDQVSFAQLEQGCVETPYPQQVIPYITYNKEHVVRGVVALANSTGGLIILGLAQKKTKAGRVLTQVQPLSNPFALLETVQADLAEYASAHPPGPSGLEDTPLPAVPYQPIAWTAQVCTDPASQPGQPRGLLVIQVQPSAYLHSPPKITQRPLVRHQYQNKELNRTEHQGLAALRYYQHTTCAASNQVQNTLQHKQASFARWLSVQHAMGSDAIGIQALAVPYTRLSLPRPTPVPANPQIAYEMRWDHVLRWHSTTLASLPDPIRPTGPCQTPRPRKWGRTPA